MKTYRIRPNYRTMHLGLSKLLGKLVVKYVTTYTKGTLKNDQEKLNLMMHIWFFSDFLYKSICCGYSFELHQQVMFEVDTIQMGTHNICLYKEVDKYTGCNLKTTETLDCALIGVCWVVRSNTVCCGYSWEVPHCDASNEYPQHTIFKKKKNKKNMSTFGSKKRSLSGTTFLLMWPSLNITIPSHLCSTWIQSNLINFIINKT